MILLTGSSSLRVYLGAAATTNQLPIVATYIDSNSTVFNPLAAETQTNDTTPVTIIDPPASGISRQLKYLSILNTDSATNDVYIEYHTPTSDRRVFKQAITTNQKIEYVDSEGFEVIPGAFINVTGDAVTGVPFITHGSTALLGNYRIGAARSGISIIDDAVNGGEFSYGLSGNMYHNITGHTGDLSQHITGLSISNQLLDQTLVWNTTGWINKYAHAVVYATNAEVDTLNVGEVVYLSGAQGDRASVRRASNLYENTSSKTVGMISQAITSNNPGPVVTLGYVEKLSLGAYSPGDVLWLGDTPGTFTKNKPSAPNHLVFIGVVARANAGNGIAFIRTQNGYELEELHDVKLSTGSLVSGNFLGWNGLYWTNTGLNTGFISGFNEGVQDVISNTLYATSGLAIIYNDSTDQIFISGQRATTTTLGLASFNNGNFTVDSGAVSISAIPTGTVTDLNLAIKDQIGNSGFFEYRGGITGYWNQGSRTLTLNMFSGAGGGPGSSTLDGLTDVDVPAPVSGNYLHYNGATWIANSIRTGDIVNLTEHTQDVIAASLAATSGLAILYNDTAGTITISGQRASNTATFTGIGLAGFNATYFATASGIVSITGGIQTGQILEYGVTTGQVSNLSEAIQDTVAASLASTSGLAILYDDAAGIITISGQRATTAAPGLAIFSATNFSVSSGLALITGGLQTGFIVSLPQAITATVGSVIGLDDLTGIYLGTMNSGEYLFFNGTGWVGNSILTEAISAMKVPNGHESRSTSTLSFDEPSRTFSITPVGSSFSFWTSGRKYTKTTAQSVSIPDTTGLYYFYFNRDGALAYKNTYFDFESDVHTAYVYWNSTTDKAYYFADERHGTTMDWQTHEYLHRTRGAAYANGFGLSNYNISGDGSSDAHAKLDIANGTFFDEDIEVNITNSATPAANSWEQVLQGNAEIPIFYLSGDSWIRDAATEFPLKQGINTAQYNLLSGAIWTGVDLSGYTSNQTGYGVTWIVATNNLNSPVLGLLGQVNYTGLGHAESAVWADMSLPGFPVFEFRPLYKVIYEAYSGYTNTVSAKFKSIADIRVTQSVAQGLPAVAVADHGSLVGLLDDDHPQYPTVNGSRGFSQPVSGRNPLEEYDLSTRKYVDDRTQFASTVNSGIAYFDSNYFDVTDGLVTLNGISITDLTDTATLGAVSGQALVFDGNVWRNSGLSTGNIFNLPEAIKDTIGTTLVTTSGLAVIYSDSTNQIILSGQRADNTNIGLAAFDATNFTVSSGLVSIAGGIQTGQIVGYGVTTGQITSLPEAIQDVVAATLLTTTGLYAIYNDTDGTIILSGQRATTTDLGIAAFSSTNFTVSSGVVTISAVPTGAITNYGVTTGQITNLGEAVQDIVAAALVGYTGLTVVYDDTNGSVLISGWRATTSTLGLSYYDSNNFSVASGLVSISAIQTGQITNYGVTTGQITNLPEAVQDIVASTLATTTGLTVVYDDTNGIIILSGQRATTSTLGISYFDSSNFAVNSGLVTISTIQTGQISNYGVTTGQITSLPEAIQDVVAATLVTTTGITVVYDDTNGQIILSGQRATTSTLGISYFDSNNFTVASGLVSISAIPTGIITNYGVTTGQITNLIEAVQDIAAAAIVTTSGLAVIYPDPDNQIVISGQRATTTNIGLASFDSNNFSVASGAVSISAVATGTVTNLPDAVKDTIGNSGFFNYRGGLTGLWDQPTKTLTLNWVSGSVGGAAVLGDLTDVSAESPVSGNYLHYNGTQWISELLRTGNILNLPNAIKDTIGNSGFFEYRGGITGIWNQGSRVLTLNWRSGAPGGGVNILDDLSDVEAASPNLGDILYYTSPNWVNSPLDSLTVTSLYSNPTGFAMQGSVILTGRGSTTIWSDYSLGRILISGDDTSRYVRQDGTRSFTGTIAGIDPTGVYDLSTKQYVDTQDLVVFNYFAANAQPTNSVLTNITLNTYSSGNFILFTGTTGTTTGYISTSGQNLVRAESPHEMRNALLLNDVGWYTKIKPTNEVRALDGAILRCDDTLFLPLVANTNYTIRGQAYYTTQATPDFKFAFTGVTGSEWIVRRQNILPETTGLANAAVDKWPAVYNSGVTGFQAAGAQQASTKVIAVAGNAGVAVVEWSATILNSGNTGIFGLVWAQNTSNSAATTVYKGSYIQWRTWN